MKIKVPGKSNKKQKEESPPWDEGQSLGSTEELADPKYLEKQRSRHRKNGTLDRYCEMLETQVSSLAIKVLGTHEKYLDLQKELDNMGKDLDDKPLKKALNEARRRINSASNELSQAQQYIRDNL